MPSSVSLVSAPSVQAACNHSFGHCANFAVIPDTPPDQDIIPPCVRGPFPQETSGLNRSADRLSDVSVGLFCTPTSVSLIFNISFDLIDGRFAHILGMERFSMSEQSAEPVPV